MLPSPPEARPFVCCRASYGRSAVGQFALLLAQATLLRSMLGYDALLLAQDALLQGRDALLLRQDL